MATERETSLYNFSGAVIFSTYVVSALLLTLLICRSLIFQHQKLRKAEDTKRTIDLERRLQFFSTLSVLSFSTLSYHMLSYLIISYQKWAETNGVLLPQRILGDFGIVGRKDQRVEVHIWEWLTSSTLFQDFAMTICNDSARFWWTQQALLVTMAWSVFMSFEGFLVFPTASKAPHSNDSRAETEHTPSMGIRIYQPDPTCFLRPESLFPCYAAETCVESQPTNMDAHSDNPAPTPGGVLYLRPRSAICGRDRRFHKHCHTDPAVARGPVDFAGNNRRGRWTELSDATKSALGRCRPLQIHRYLLGLALVLADLRGAQ